MVLQSIILYSTLILVMVFFAKLYSLSHTSQIHSSGRTYNSQMGIICLLFIIFSFSILMGLRYDVGTDYFVYQEGYIYDYDVGKGEVIFNWIRKTFNSFELHYSVYFAFLAFLNIAFFINAFKRDAFILPLLLFFLFTNADWLFWMNGIRQAIAMCIWLYALNFIEKKKFWWYLLWCLIAMGFHISAVILIPLYFLLKNGKDYFKNIKLQFILLAGAFLVQFSFSAFLVQIEPLIHYYQAEIFGGAYNYSMERFQDEASVNVEGSGIAYIFRIVLSILIILLSKEIKEYYNYKWFNIIYSLFFIGLIAQHIFPVGTVVLSRPFRYFFIFEGVMFAYLTYYLVRHYALYKKIGGIGLILLFIGIFYLNIITANENSHLWYRFYFE